MKITRVGETIRDDSGASDMNDMGVKLKTDKYKEKIFHRESVIFEMICSSLQI